MRPSFLLPHALALLATLLAACSGSPEHVEATQITVRIYAAEEVRARWAQLRLRSYREIDGEYEARAELSFDKRKLDEVVDLVLARRDAFDGNLLVVVDALDRDGQVLVQARATFYFLTGQQRLLELWLYPCGLKTLGELCSEADCEGDACLTCVDNRCEPTPFYDPNEFTTFDPQAATSFKPPAWLDAGENEPPGPSCEADAREQDPDCSVPDEGGAAEAMTPSTSPEAGSDASAREAGVDAGPVDAGSDANLDAGFDASVDAGTATGGDAGMDTGTDTGPPDTGMDTGDSNPPLSALGRCATWTTITLNGPTTPTPLPSSARQLAEQMTANRGTLKQYLCRVTTPDNTLTPGKVSEDPDELTSSIDYTCYAAWYDSVQMAWREFGNDAMGARFEMLTPPADCQLQWAAAPAAGVLPARALQTGGTSAAPLYSCRFAISTSEPDGIMRSGTHIGRVSAGAGDVCRVQYYAGFRQSSTYDVLVQSN
jgi:hypothetical protein